MTTKHPPVRCVYCGSPDDLTRDHIPPKAVFPDAPQHRFDLITVPACGLCNRRFSTADQYFSFAVASHMLTGTNPISQTLHPRTKRGFERILRSRLGKKIRRELQLVEQRTPAGILLGHQPAWAYDAKMLQLVGCRIIQGLHFHHLKRPLTKGTPVRSIILTDIPQRTPEDEEGLKPMRDMLAQQPVHNIGSGVFRYRYLVAPENPDVSVWLMIFYDAIEFAGSTGIGTAPGTAPADGTDVQ